MIRVSRPHRGSIGCLVVATSVFSVVLRAQDDPLAWFPLSVGSHWVYEHEWKSGDRNHPDTDRWTTGETLAGWISIPEGLVVLREVKQLGDAANEIITRRVITPDGQVREVPQKGNLHTSAYLVARDSAPYLVHGNCVYVIGGGWDAQTQQLRPQYRKYLSQGTLPPDFCFPLRLGSEWGNNDMPWRVEPARDGVGSFLPAEHAGAIHILSSHFGSGGSMDVWFQKGLGVVGEHYIHSGTYDEYTKKLRSFER